MNIKERLEQDLRDSVDAVLSRIQRGNLELGQVQQVASMLTQAAGFAHQLYGVHLKEWSDKE